MATVEHEVLGNNNTSVDYQCCDYLCEVYDSHNQ